MKAFSCLAAVLFNFSTTAFAAKSFSASNLYYAAGLKDSQSTVLLDGLKSAGVKVLRVWLDGESHTAARITRGLILIASLHRPIR
jgi:mannan endo-1,4-beta-mannosidase